MFAYCENNAVNYIDPTGYWSSSDHKDMTNKQGFSGKTYENVRNWTYKADTKGFASTNEYSAPFHGRAESLDIGKCLYNLAMDVKKNKKKYKFSESSRSGYYKLPNVLKYTPKNKNKTGHIKAAKNATSNFISTLNNAKDYTVQWQILLGLALHTFQDYFAHVIRATVIRTTNNYYKQPSYKNKKEWQLYMYEVDDKMGLSNSYIEDNKSVFSWRYDSAKSITKKIYDCWKNNNSINSITVSINHNNQYRYRRLTYQSGTRYYWTIYTYKYVYTIK